jgi:galactosylceramidase
VVGDDSWTNYTVNSDVLLNSQSDHAGLISRFAGTCQFFATTCERGDAQNFDGYEFTVEGDGSWDLYRNSTTGGRTALDSGTLPASLDGAWHHLSLNATGSTLTGSIDGQPVTTVNDATYGHGLAGIESNWSHVQYDALNVL